ncbi:MAG: Maf family protein [Enterocloster sp.]
MELTDNWRGWHVVLASGSPRRKELLEQIGIRPEIRPSLIKESTEEKKPDLLVMELSRMKAEDIASGCPEGTLVIGADTVVAAGSEILGKPGTSMRAYEMIEKIQGRTHQVYTGVTVLLCLAGGGLHGITFSEKTDVHVYPMTGDEIREYAESGEPLDKAGAYGIQGSFAAYVKGIDGDYNNVVGLPLGRLNQEIKRLLEEREDD